MSINARTVIKYVSRAFPSHAKTFEKIRTLRELDLILDVISPRNEVGTSPAPAAAPAKSFRVVLTRVGLNKIGVIKAVREITNLGLKEAKDISDYVSETSAEKCIADTTDLAWAERAQRLITSAGGSGEVRPA